jgi:UDP-glucose 4-epimerase
MKYLVTGAAGFIGSHLVDRLIGEGNEVVVIDDLSTGKKENINSKAVFYNTDICDTGISEIFKKEKPELLFHLAAQIDVRKSVADPIHDAQINILGSLNLFENSRQNNVKKIIFMSTGGAIYGDADVIPTPETYKESPVSPYGVAKLSIDKYLHYYQAVFGLSYISLRPSNVYGPRQSSKGEAGVVAIFCDQMLAKKTPIIYGDGRQTRDFVYVDDVIDACIAAANSDKTGIYNIGTGIETSITRIFELIRGSTGAECEPIYAPARSGEQKKSCLDSSKIKKDMGWSSKIGIEEGIKKTVEYFRKK